MDPETRDFLESPEFVMPMPCASALDVGFYRMKKGPLITDEYLAMLRVDDLELYQEDRIYQAAQRLVAIGVAA